MKIVFVENRGKTVFWSAVARELMRHGHDVAWLVQNPAYAPPVDAGTRFSLGFPKAADLVDAPIPPAVLTDRGRQFFCAGSQHYSFYANRIAVALDHLCPDVVIGEPTLMHELLTIAECNRRGIPYFHPTVTRYPGGRFSVLNGATQEPLMGGHNVLPYTQLIDLANAIASGRSLPSYMKKPSRLATPGLAARKILGQCRVSFGWFIGERFNTPSPMRKLALQRKLRRNLNSWQALARLPDMNGPVILYPLQMQPESNIDVWGRPYFEQSALVLRLLEAIPASGCVAVKANPKPKYEVSEQLLDLARINSRIILLPLHCSMGEAQSRSVGAVTVSGTVGYEAVFGRGRCLSLRHPVFERYFPEFHAQTPEEAVARLLADEHAGRGSVERGTELLARLVADSFEGTINEPLFDSNCLSDENINKVTNALLQVMQYTQYGAQ
ncbi:MAG: hypothetical protein O3C15_01295 [Proteobacteria bacterium]|nr:hypothetical protein [Pseudomonadota bacterium]